MVKRRGLESIDSLIEKKVKDVVEEKIGDEDTDYLEQSDDPALQKILSSFPSTEGYYGKLYKILPSGKEEMKHTFEALEEISDPEIEVSHLAKERGWGSGDYRLRVYKHDSPGLQKSLAIRIDVGDTNKNQQGLIQPQNISDTIKQTLDVATALKQISQPDLPMREINEAISTAYKTGIQVTREALLPQIQNQSDSAIKVVSMLKELGLLEKKPQVSEMEVTERVIKNLKEMGIIAQPKNEDDILNKLIKLREVGLIKMAGEDKEDVSALAEKIRPIIDLVQSLGLGGVTPEKPNFWTTLAPHIPSFIEKLASPLREYLEIRKIELQQRIQNLSSVPNQNIQQIPQSNIPIQNPKEESKENLLAQNPIISEIVNAVQERNHSFFPRLKELLTIFIGGHIFDAIISGQVSKDTVFSLITSSQYGKFFNNEQSKIYFNDFIEWIKKSEVDIKGNGSFYAKCNKCNIEYVFTEEEWANDSKICDCGGTLEKIQVAI